MVEYIKHNEEKLPILLNVGVFGKVSSKLNIKLSDLPSTIDNLECLLLAFELSLKSGYNKEKKTYPDYSEDQIEEIFTDNINEFMVIYSLALMKCFAPKEQREVMVNELKKKILTPQ